MRGAALLGAILLFAGAARAERSIALLQKPWGKQTRGELRAAVEAYLDGRTDGGNDVGLRRYEAGGRVRLRPGDATSPAFGFELVQLDIETTDPRLPERLTDQTLSFGLPLGERWGWTFEAVVGVGFAGDLPYSDGDAWYLQADLGATRAIDRGTRWLLYLNYDGNRTIFPDVPLPAFAYERFVGPHLLYRIGFPFSQVRWKPAEGWTIEARALLFFDADLIVTRTVSESVDLHVSLTGRTRAYHASDLPEHRRLFFRQRLAEAGVTWSPDERWTLRFAAGYAFDQEFETGFDVRSTSGEVDLRDRPYGRFEVRLRF